MILLPSAAHSAGICGSGSLATTFNAFTSKLDYVCVASADILTFSVSTFADGASATQEIGAGTWKAIGALSYTATYANGTVIGATVTVSSLTGGLAMTNSFLGPTVSTAAVTYPAVGGTRVMTLSATTGTSNATKTITHTFVNDRYWGVNIISSNTYSSADVTALAGSELSNSIAKTFTVTPGAGQYIVYSYPDRLGTASFSVNGFSGGFLGPFTATVTNGSGYSETFNVYRSVNANLGSTTVAVTTP